ncbi:MAG: DUF3108 domain-containing protein [Tannerellaceae bacterium]|jgi:hypothetical protein|nr:DUF3108 domain-containing protein [Tannerellaceae bacterium]
MKENDNHPPAVRDCRVVCAFRARLFFLLFLLVCPLGRTRSDSCLDRPVLHPGERLTYELYFKWGFLMPKAGLAQFSVSEARYGNLPAWEYRMQFHTVGMFERIFKMRDTLTTYFSPVQQLLFSDKRTDEGGYYLADRMYFTPLSSGETSVRSLRHNRSGLRLDTTLVVGGCAFDMMAATLYLRAIGWQDLKVRDEFPFRVVVGKDVVRASFRYTGQAVVSPGGRVKYRTHHFFIDVYDPAFEQSKEAAEVWIGDDENHLPIRVRAKLAIGAVEVYLGDAVNLRHAFASRIPGVGN